jgi:outer membrane protein assembly factor BamB
LILGETLVISTSSGLAGVAAETGKPLWKRTVEGFDHRRITVDGAGRVLAGTNRGELLVLRGVDGKLLLRYDLNEHPQAAEAPVVHRVLDGTRRADLGRASCPLVDGDRVLLQTTSGWAVAFELPPLE